MIDVDAPGDLLPTGSDRRIGEELTRAVPRAEGVSAPSPFHLENTAAFTHRSIGEFDVIDQGGARLSIPVSGVVRETCGSVPVFRLPVGRLLKKGKLQ
jgi:hypothetical protein